MKRALKIFLSAAIFVVVATGCAKKKNDVNQVSTDQYLAKADLTGCQAGRESSSCQKVYSMVKTIMAANEELDSSGVIPGTHVDFGLVKFVVTKDELQLRRVDEMNRDDDRASVVASYPITAQFDIIHDKNDYGEDTNKIVEDQKRPWDQRNYIRVDFSTNKLKATSLQNAFSTAIEEEDAHVTSPLQKDGSLWSFNTDATIRQKDFFDMGQEREFFSPGDLRAQVKTSFMELKKTDYKPREMANSEFARFGIFRTYENFINPDKGVTVSGKKLYTNRFNVCENSNATVGLSCATNKIVYVLNKGFPEEFRQGARDVVAAWNKTFQKALDRTDDVVVLDESVQPEVGDIRYNMINGVDEKVPTGLLGIMQNVTNSSTGETISGMASVYIGTVRLEAGLAAEQFDILVNGDQTAPGQQKGLAGGRAPGALEEILARPSTLLADLKFETRLLQAENFKTPQALVGISPATVAMAARQSQDSQDLATSRRAQALERATAYFGISDPAVAMTRQTDSLDELKSNLSDAFMLSKDAKLAGQKALAAAEKGIHGSEFVEPAIESFVRKFVAAHKGENNAQIREELKAQVRKMVFETTLVHEMGHTFGLRHNFASSGDKDNFTDTWKRLEEQKKSLASKNPNDPAIADIELQQESYDFSSVMDYTADFHETQDGPGPYDLAAIRYAYNGSIDKTADKIAGGNHSYKFCTDHQLHEDLLCSQWDKGSNVTSTTANLIDRYNRMYVYRNFRRDRELWGNPWSYFNNILMGTMFPIRQVSDEFLYQLITSASTGDGGICGIKLVADSIKAGEFANICDDGVLKKYLATGIDFSDWANWIAFLLKDDLSDFRQAPKTYKANGFADLMFANLLARNFFTRVIGTPEPGSYFANPQADGSAVLEALPAADGGAGDDARLIAYLRAKGMSDDQIQALLPQARDLVVDLNPGPQAKYLSSQLKSDGSFTRIETIGYLYDKLAAILIMGARGLPVRKYQAISMNTNMYLSPQTKSTTLALFNALIAGNPTVTSLPVTTRGGLRIKAAAPASYSLETKYYGLLFAASDLISTQDRSMVDRLRICLQSDNRCQNPWGLEQVSFRGTQSQDVYSAVQVLTDDSIAVNLVKKGDQLSKDRDQAVTDIKGRADLVKQLGDKIKSDPAAKSGALLDLVKLKAPDLAPALAKVFAVDNAKPTPDTRPTLLQRLIAHAKDLDNVDASTALSEKAEVPVTLKKVNDFLAENLKDKKDILAEISASVGDLGKDMTDMSSLTARIVASPVIFRNANSKLPSIEADAATVRDLLKTLGVD